MEWPGRWFQGDGAVCAPCLAPQATRVVALRPGHSALPLCAIAKLGAGVSLGTGSHRHTQDTTERGALLDGKGAGVRRVGGGEWVPA